MSDAAREKEWILGYVSLADKYRVGMLIDRLVEDVAAEQTARADAKEAELEEALAEVARLNEALETELAANAALADWAEAAEALVGKMRSLLDSAKNWVPCHAGFPDATQWHKDVGKLGRECICGPNNAPSQYCPEHGALLADPTGQWSK